jgi:hypothetical protein
VTGASPSPTGGSGIYRKWFFAEISLEKSRGLPAIFRRDLCDSRNYFVKSNLFHEFPQRFVNSEAFLCGTAPKLLIKNFDRVVCSTQVCQYPKKLPAFMAGKTIGSTRVVRRNWSFLPV